MALGGVATGSIKAKEAAITQGNIRYKGFKLSLRALNRKVGIYLSQELWYESGVNSFNMVINCFLDDIQVYLIHTYWMDAHKYILFMKE